MMDIEGRDILAQLGDLQSELALAAEYGPDETIEAFLERSMTYGPVCDTLRTHQHLPPKQEPNQ